MTKSKKTLEKSKEELDFSEESSESSIEVATNVIPPISLPSTPNTVEKVSKKEIVKKEPKKKMFENPEDLAQFKYEQVLRASKASAEARTRKKQQELEELAKKQEEKQNLLEEARAIAKKELMEQLIKEEKLALRAEQNKKLRSKKTTAKAIEKKQKLLDVIEEQEAEPEVKPVKTKASSSVIEKTTRIPIVVEQPKPLKPWDSLRNSGF